MNGTTVRLGGFAKGSGMIHPNMATMLAVVTCDAAVEPRLWRRMLSAATDASFNQITVDGDSSTNDTVIALASGAAGGARLASERDPGAAALQAALTALLQGLAKAIAWDGEGATCLIECRVAGAASDGGARAVARSVVASSLTKAAVFGHDPNWGRIACAAGYGERGGGVGVWGAGGGGGGRWDGCGRQRARRRARPQRPPHVARPTPRAHRPHPCTPSLTPQPGSSSTRTLWTSRWAPPPSCARGSRSSSTPCKRRRTSRTRRRCMARS